MPTTSIRTAVARRLIDLLRADPTLTDATIRYGAPDQVGTLAVFVQIAEDGGTTTANMRAGRKSRNDEFDLEVWVALHVPGSDQLEAAERVELAWASVENVLADSPTLALDGDGVPGLIHAMQAGDSDGPRTTPTETGVLCWWVARISCLARLD
jgi:hypothetical protein